MSWSARLLGPGLALAALIAGVAAVARGGNAALAAACGSALALAAQVAAIALLRPAMGARIPEFMRRWAAGIAIRGASLVLLVGLMLLARRTYPILWMVAGYLGVMLPLLFTETRFLR
ncbi:MAG: hypothetical protein E4H17_04810 [Gemmatimonadales bacterium]|nr:MAG: hypothetical protein E4H17_04810 [Gemmatimonadales bacterium]